MFELTTLVFDTQDELLKAVGKHTRGCDKHLAWGAFAKVYDAGENQVMKLSGGDDIGYLAYLKTLNILNIKNRYLPVIHNATYFRLSDKARSEGGMWRHKERIVTYMEKLKQPPKRDRKEYNPTGGLKNTWWPPVKKWTSMVSDYVLWDLRHCEHLRLEHQELIVFLKIAHEMHLDECRKTNEFGRLDLHAGNVLARGTQFVVTDPLA